VVCNINIVNAKIVSSAMEIGYFLLYSSNWMKIYIIKFELMKFKSKNITNYTLKLDFKGEIN
jgi:hypothetical protein